MFTHHLPPPPPLYPLRIHKIKTESKRAKNVEDQATAAKKKAGLRREKMSTVKARKA